MKVAGKIARRINRMEEGIPFRYMQLGVAQTEYGAAAKAIERLVRKGIIQRISNGVFYKPRQSVFGALRPGEKELLKPYLFQDGKRIAYITGGSLYNRMGLTTQVPNMISVASRAKRVTTKIGTTQVKPVKSYVEVSDENYALLEILDAIKDIKTIPDLDMKSAISLLQNRIGKLSESDLARLVRCALEYPPRTRAFLGALLMQMGISSKTKTLKASLNPFSRYRLGITSESLPTAADWNID